MAGLNLFVSAPFIWTIKCTNGCKNLTCFRFEQKFKKIRSVQSVRSQFMRFSLILEFELIFLYIVIIITLMVISSVV